jgi:limonene-1,2-epoxide hydrolase
LSIEQLVRNEMAAWGRNDVDEVASHFADDAQFDIGPAWPKVSGRDAIYELLKQFFAGGTCIELEIRHLAVDGDVVLMERQDHWLVGDQKMSWPVMGAYEVHDDKITAWREYYFPPSES